MKPVFILGGYGNFGKRIARALTHAEIPVIIAGRSAEKAQTAADQCAEGLAQAAAFDAFTELEGALKAYEPVCIVHTCGPFQTNDTRIIETAIRCQIPLIDLADGRKYVTNIDAFETAAKQANIPIISGASSVPGLSSAVIEHYRPYFQSLEDLTFGISPGQRAERGRATTEGILSYVGKPLAPSAGSTRQRYGWQDLYSDRYPDLGRRWFANCDIPDLDLFPRHYGLQTVQFSAGLELFPLHFGLWGLSWLRRLGLPLPLERWAGLFLSASNLLNRFGSADGGMHLHLTGRDHKGSIKKLKWYIIAKDEDGPHIPTVPAIILAKQIARRQFSRKGAMACVGLVSLDDYLAELAGYAVTTSVHWETG